jgi:hypothetical protein
VLNCYPVAFKNFGWHLCYIMTLYQLRRIFICPGLGNLLVWRLPKGFSLLSSALKFEYCGTIPNYPPTSLGPPETVSMQWRRDVSLTPPQIKPWFLDSRARSLIAILIYRTSHEERPVFWEATVSIIISKKRYVCTCVLFRTASEIRAVSL